MPPEGSDLIFDHRHNAEMSTLLIGIIKEPATRRSAAVPASPTTSQTRDIIIRLMSLYLATGMMNERSSFMIWAEATRCLPVPGNLVRETGCSY
jgi:hypothetical protein